MSVLGAPVSEEKNFSEFILCVDLEPSLYYMCVKTSQRKKFNPY